MKGIELARVFYQQIGEPVLRQRFPQYMDQIAAGLVGEGSECFGFDDAISHDHDFGARFCLWLPDELYAEIGGQLQRAYEELPDTFAGFPVIRERAAGGARRSGVFAISEFYNRLLMRQPDNRFPDCSLEKVVLPASEEDWFTYRESALAVVTNGEVFADPAGHFTAVREKLCAYYPENVRLKKLAVSLMYMAQTGQVNYARSMERGDTFAAGLCKTEFVRAALSTLYLLNRKYMPYYKWAGKGLENARVFTDGIVLLKKLQENRPQAAAWRTWKPGTPMLNMQDENVKDIETFCGRTAEELRRQNLTDSGEVFLNPQGIQVLRHITNREILRQPVRMPEWMG